MHVGDVETKSVKMIDIEFPHISRGLFPSLTGGIFPVPHETPRWQLTQPGETNRAFHWMVK